MYRFGTSSGSNIVIGGGDELSDLLCGSFNGWGVAPMACDSTVECGA